MVMYIQIRRNEAAKECEKPSDKAQLAIFLRKDLYESIHTEDALSYSHEDATLYDEYIIFLIMELPKGKKQCPF